jgi:hypothetical protein
MGPCLVSMGSDAPVSCGVWLKNGAEVGPSVLIHCHDEFFHALECHFPGCL